MKKIGLALGAGGARGLAQIVILEAFEELGIKPSIISGTSIGAIIGALYASGVSPEEMKTIVKDVIFTKNVKFWELHKKNDLLKMMNFVAPNISPGGLIKSDRFMNFLSDYIKVSTLEKLDIPLKVIATDYWNKNEVVLERGNLLQSIKASFSLPGLFSPVELNKTLLIDGGMVNPLPYDVIKNDCDITVAIDVSASKSRKGNSIPSSYEMLFSAFQIMQNSIVNEKIKRVKPSIHIKTNIMNIRVHEFMKVDSIFEEAKVAKKRLKKKLAALIS
ncbi:MAG: patatin-like phospholipase family protein [Melioribacteraceae bacterium]|nr:patatin-like phospholipase family protein [Melioribacteraceae bacterium]